MNIWNVFNGIAMYYQNNKKQDIQLLDPVTTVFKLCLLKFKEKGTKISIKQNNVSYHEPSLFQGVQRWLSGDERNDLYKLYTPLKIFMQWYHDLQHLDFIIRVLKEGIENLQLTYRNHHILIHTLDHYKNISSDHQPKEMYNKFKELWSKEEIILIVDMMMKIRDENCDSMIKAIECILDGKQEEILTMINHIL